MPVDKGGMQYRIEAQNDSAAAIQLFTTSVNAATQAWLGFKAAVSTGAGTAKVIADMNAVAAAQAKAAKAAADKAAADRKASAEELLHAKAIAATGAALDKKAVASEAGRISQERGFAAERRLATQAQLRAQAENELTAAINKRERAELIVQAAQDRGVVLSDKEAKSLGLLSKAQLQLLAAREAQAKAATASSPELIRINAETAALNRETAARKEALTQQILSARGLTAQGTPIPAPELPQSRTVIDKIRDFLGLSGAIANADDKANKISFTFRRLFGILAAFTAARLLITFFKDAIVESVAFNARLQQTELGIAAVIGAVGEIRDASGQQVAASEKLTLAQGTARRQVQLLRIDALKTTASFDDLAEAFQNALGPGLAAGLNVDQIRAFTREISIAAETIGLKQNQLAEEVRSILSGNISVRNTRIATALGITSKDISNAKTAGDLFGFLQNKFAVFNAAGEKVAKTLPGVFSNVKKAISLILGAGGEALSKDLQKSLDQTFRSLIRLDEATGNINLNPDLIAAVAAFDKGLQGVLRTVEDVISRFDSGDLVKVAENLGKALDVFAKILAPLIEGALKGFLAIAGALNTIGSIVNGIGNGLENAFGSFGAGIVVFFKETLRGAVSQLTALVVGFSLFKLVLSGFGKIATLALSGLSVAFRVLGLTSVEGTLKLGQLATAIKTASVAAAGVVPEILLVVGALAGLVLIVEQLNGDLDLSNTLLGRFGAKTISSAATFALFVQGIQTGNLALVQQAVAMRKEMSAAIDSVKPTSLTDAFGEGLDKLEGRFAKFFGGLKKSIADITSSTDPEAIIINTSEALKKLSTQLQALEDDAAAAKARAQADIAAIGVPGSVGQQVKVAAASAARATKEIFDLERDRKANLQAIAVLQRNIANGEISSAKDLEEAEAKRTALLAQNKEIEEAELEIRKGLAAAVRDELTALALLQAFELKRSNAIAGPEAANAERLRLAKKEHDERVVIAIEEQQALEELIIKQKQQAEDRKAELDAVTQKLVEVTQREQELAALPSRSDAQELELEAARANIAAETKLLGLLKEQNEQQNAIADAALKEAEDRATIAKDIANSPISTGLVEAFGRAFEVVADKFRTTIEIMSSAIRGFSSFVAESIVSAFDPTNDTSVKERFARFLQGLATQIIETLVTLAITAAVLNAASGGLLGPLLKGFSDARFGGQGRHDGGPAEGRHDGGRARRSHRHARGYAEGGSPVARGVHGVERPSSGLHPADTVPIWADPSEWIIRGRSVAKAGADAIQTINEGLFDPYALRGALGLSSFRRPATSIGRGQGFVDGGAVASATSSVGRRAATSGGAPVPAVVVSSENEMDRLLRGGSNAMDRYLAERGYFPASRR